MNRLQYVSDPFDAHSTVQAASLVNVIGDHPNLLIHAGNGAVFVRPGLRSAKPASPLPAATTRAGANPRVRPFCKKPGRRRISSGVVPPMPRHGSTRWFP